MTAANRKKHTANLHSVQKGKNNIILDLTSFGYHSFTTGPPAWNNLLEPQF